MTIHTGAAPIFAPDRPLAGLDVPLDERDERALPLAARLATRWDLPVRLLHVVTNADDAAFDLPGVAAGVGGRWPDLTIDTEQLTGDDVAAAITSASGPASLLIIATDNANAWSFKGSVAERLVHGAANPLILLGPQANSADATGDVVVAYDGRPSSASAALEAAVALAPAIGRNLWLIQVVPEAGGPDVELHPEVGLELTRLVEGIDQTVSPRWEVVHSNDPVSAIESFASRVGASFIVAAARRRTDQTRTTMSSITMGLVASAGRPVLVVGH